jgi:hypothetical protein
MAHIGTAARGVDHTGGIGTIGAGVIGMVVTGTVGTGMAADTVIIGVAVSIIELI